MFASLRQIRQRFENAGEFMSTHKRHIALATALLSLYIVALGIGAAQLFFMVAAIVSLTTVSHLMTKLSLRNLTCSLSGPADVSEGQIFEWMLTIQNEGWLPRFFIEAELPLPVWLEPVERPCKTFLSYLAAGERCEVRWRVQAMKRGVYPMEAVRLTVYEPLGLFAGMEQARLSYELVVTPQLVPVNLLVEGGAQAPAEGESSQSRRGEGTAFWGVREYQPGDALRHIHWKVTAHTGRISVMEMEQEWHKSCLLLLDCRKEAHWGEGRDASIEWAVKAAASVAAHFLSEDSAVTFLAPPYTPLQGLRLEGKQALNQLLHLLARVEPVPELSIEDLALPVREHLDEGLVVLIGTSLSRPVEQVLERSGFAAERRLCWLKGMN